MFDAIAPRYDFLNHVLSAGIDHRWRTKAIKSLALTGRERVLDLCTGTGDLAIAARTTSPGAARVIGVDFSAAMLRVGQEKLRARRLVPAVASIRGDATRIPIASRSVDAAMVAFGIRNVNDMPAAFAEMHRVLVTGGRLAILEFGNPTMPGIRQAYRWYSTHVLPRIGRLVSRNGDAYQYLPASIEAFATPDSLVELLRRAGFADITARPLTFGTVYLYTAKAGASAKG
jgi:demethylmenaquinone methyltransferase/2-methoxy-6-polyprenyl-1,4-benzoquinol methylase